jgi:tripartite-type tricarboxylate transporter receptor subunit TctC
LTGLPLFHAIRAAAPDGYTVGMITFELNSLPPQGLVPFTWKDFDSLMRVNSDPAALTVKADAPYKTLKAKIAECYKKAFDSPDFKEFAKKASLNLAYQNSADFAKFLDQNYKDVEAVMKSLGMAKK